MLKIGRRYIQEELENTYDGKTLPHIYKSVNSNLWNFVVIAAVLHVLFCGAMYIAIEVLGLKFLTLQKPEWKTRDIEFVLTENEATPINKNTKYRSDKNSRAGGKHNPAKKVAMPSSPAPAPSTKPKQQQNALANILQPKQTPKPAQAKAPTPQTPVQQGVSRPSKPTAPAQKPVLKPNDSTPKPQMPKLANAPSSPFKVAVPNTGAPVGKGFSTSQGSASTGGGAQGSPSGSGKGISGMPAPQFSTTKTANSGSGSAAGKPGGKGVGGYGTGQMGNPGPGNPNGAPGIDAIKAPQWGPYMTALEAKIKRNWHPPKGDQSKRVVLLFSIGRNGELLSVKVSKSSGSPENDKAAISAVQMSAPFRALPPEYTGRSVDIDFTFDYNVLGAARR